MMVGQILEMGMMERLLEKVRQIEEAKSDGQGALTARVEALEDMHELLDEGEKHTHARMLKGLSPEDIDTLRNLAEAVVADLEENNRIGPVSPRFLRRVMQNSKAILRTLGVDDD